MEVLNQLSAKNHTFKVIVEKRLLPCVQDIQCVTEMSADFSCGSREHPYKYFNTMNLRSEMDCYGSTP